MYKWANLLCGKMLLRKKSQSHKHCVCNSFVIWCQLSWARGKDICVDNTLKDKPKSGRPPRRPLESCVTAVPAEATSHGKCESPRRNACLRFFVFFSRKNGNIHGERGEQVHKERQRERKNGQTAV